MYNVAGSLSGKSSRTVMGSTLMYVAIVKNTVKNMFFFTTIKVAFKNFAWAAIL